MSRFLMPFAVPTPPAIKREEIPQIAGGNWETGPEAVHGQSELFEVPRQAQGGNRVGPDLDNLVHRDYAGVLRDIVDPSATINPDAIGYHVLLDDGRTVSERAWRRRKMNCTLFPQAVKWRSSRKVASRKCCR